MSDRRVVITGIGVFTPLGNDPETFWKALCEGKSGIRTIESMDTSAYSSKIAGEVRDFDADSYFNNTKDARRTDRYGQFAVAGARRAFEDAGFEQDSMDPDRFGVMVGSGIGGLAMLQTQHHKLMKSGPSRVSPFTIPMMISNIGSGLVSMELGLRGPNMSIVTACATANHNIGEAWRIIKFGDADAFVAGGSEASVLEMGLAGFGSMKALSCHNDSPAEASRPFDRERDGFVMGEGAGVVVLEELEHAKKRGAEIYCELVGYGISGDAYHLSAPHPEGEGAARAMDMALKHAKTEPSGVGYLNAHATSTPLGDICETKAIKNTFGAYAKDGLLVSSTKSMTGHLLGAAGGVELAVSIFALRDGVVPPTINLNDPDPECDLDYVPNTARETSLDIAMSNSFGFGGHNATLVVRKFRG